MKSSTSGALATNTLTVEDGSNITSNMNDKEEGEVETGGTEQEQTETDKNGTDIGGEKEKGTENKETVGKEGEELGNSEKEDSEPEKEDNLGLGEFPSVQKQVIACLTTILCHY